ncbi:Ubiquitin-like modifier HUB1 [Fulvia fulva]|uniref:Ubiquitin-like modifier HUB1 n=1 Tax=Passalora fulva TaxID=5499 RepID=A0A9Q8UUQ7_PASFU|nr:Ubiquitin-like modifier HUB1 [Fulvia fulva]KAK4626218.1 Ubiquitin-like modifier HUB1 [Fulvia fulva]KAK4627988.1 Ubiquitin-like modifier HUB1 [Fulvia fulva]UJO23125.1 Ubiquitin-like modifier HUB1 [Fulvia fulva]WPV13634.1 Ubiquitin-like modifier HUB1 [Fulvia fulva]WPV28555.1 Ubiquitin-like modifier HUB1 [Fulvia fulva]
MPSDDARERSASPARESNPKKQKSSGGFKWKDKKPRDEDSNARSGGRLERGYNRGRSPRRDNYRDSDSTRDRDASRRDDRYRDRSPRRREDRDRGTTDSYRPGQPRDEDKKETSDKKEVDEKGFPISTSSKPKKDKKDKKPKQITSNEPMIVVNVNDRLGTKAAIPCLASDSVKAFKAMVAAHIGRQPHEIMLKRQGERPFKDQLSLEDYGVSNGVQLDLELDTGD